MKNRTQAPGDIQRAVHGGLSHNVTAVLVVLGRQVLDTPDSKVSKRVSGHVPPLATIFASRLQALRIPQQAIDPSCPSPCG